MHKPNTTAAELFAVWNQSNEFYSRWAEKNGVNYQELLVCYAIDALGSTTQKEICTYYGLAKQTVNNVIRNLKKQEYIVLKSSVTDKREKNLYFTESGEIYAKEMLHSLHEIEAYVLQVIGEEKVTQMLQTAMLFNTLFEKKVEELK